MRVADRRAPRKVRRFNVLARFRYNRRVYEVGEVFAPRGDVPKYRLDQLWREGCIGTLDGQCSSRELSPSRKAALTALAGAHGVE